MYSKDVLTIALDAMGGDHAPLSVVRGAYLHSSIFPKTRFIFCGDENQITGLINEYKTQDVVLDFDIIHTEKLIAPEDKPSVALRRGKDSSMWLAIDAVDKNIADAVVSAGNTGALMAIAKIILRTLPEIHRPAIAGIMPSIKGNIAMLDLGANVECGAENLFHFAVMGDAFAKAALGKENPSIGLLNIGSEDIKGNDVVRLAANMIKESGNMLNFYGYIEGNDINEGTVDVVVADGFSGNIALKTAEGTAKFCKQVIQNALKDSIFAKIGYLLAKSSITKATKTLDHRLYNGAMFVGLNGIVVKSHGSADHVGFANAIKISYELAKNNINQQIIKEIDNVSKLIIE